MDNDLFITNYREDSMFSSNFRMGSEARGRFDTHHYGISHRNFRVRRLTDPYEMLKT